MRFQLTNVRVTNFHSHAVNNLRARNVQTLTRSNRAASRSPHATQNRLSIRAVTPGVATQLTNVRVTNSSLRSNWLPGVHAPVARGRMRCWTPF